MPAPVLPRDALGVTLLVVCAAMALDILAPWSESFSVRQSLVSRFGHPAFVVVGMALVAALPLYRPQWRRSPLCAAAPLALGALSVGVGLTYYIFLARENAQALNALNPSNASTPYLQTQVTSGGGAPISPQLGLYLFILIGVVLVIVGYQLFLAAVRSQYVIIPAPQLQPFVVAQRPQMAMPAPAGLANGVPSPASVPLAPASMPPAAMVMPVAVAPAPPSQPLAPVGQPHVPAAPPTPLAPVAVQPAPVPAPAAAKKGPVLPGTDAWNEAPVSPVVNKQTRMRGGWRYSSR